MRQPGAETLRPFRARLFGESLCPGVAPCGLHPGLYSCTLSACEWLGMPNIPKVTLRSTLGYVWCAFQAHHLFPAQHRFGQSELRTQNSELRTQNSELKPQNREKPSSGPESSSHAPGAKRKIDQQRLLQTNGCFS